ncbi:MAG: bL21 family ribosomal protein [Candidatus Berkelbacteria bacterium]|nr:bL21 family ribosomal protein [Candidatus Berkelbacteria bacterium]MCR4308316.1 bL21 family ribosomal protein [Candidatus Berkelbacteria bacterium]
MESTVAIISLGGKQHLVSQGATVVINKLDSKEGEVLTLPDMLSNRTVQVKVLTHQLGKKVNGLKFKAKTRYFKRYGHRQSETTVEVVSIGTTTRKSAETAKPTVKKATPAKKTTPVKAKKATNAKS